MSDYEDDDEWRPPTAAEMKVLEARRERSNKISKRMGDYLLKGYKMLATTCGVCSTIELQDKQGQLYCVACQEIDCHEGSKDDPVFSSDAADKVIAESAFSSGTEPAAGNPDVVTSLFERTTSQPETRLLNPSVSNEPGPSTALGEAPCVDASRAFSSGTSGGAAGQSLPALRTLPPTTSNIDKDSRQLLETSLRLVKEKLNWANRRLESEQNVGASAELMVLIRECANTLTSLHQSPLFS